MRSRDHLLGDFQALNMGLYDRMVIITARTPNGSRALDQIDDEATAVVDALTRIQERYFRVLIKMDDLLGKSPSPRSSRRPPNVVSFRPPRRRR